jgi:hypothetical protein
MGEYADYLIDQMIDNGSYFRARRNTWCVTCKNCGMAGLKWREESEGWRLFENERVEHNRLKQHVCNPPSEDDFDVIG